MRPTAMVMAMALGALVLAPLASPARAWTDAQVHEVDAQVTLDDTGGADVALALLLEVRDGWLEQLELSGFHEDLTLATGDDAVALVTERGERVTPTVRAHGGAIELTFAKERAPRRGSYRIVLRYRTEALGRSVVDAHSERVRFRLPGWEGGLRAAAVTWRSSRALAPVSDEAVAQTVRAQEVDGQHTVQFRRVHLPRKTPWEVAVETHPQRRAEPAGTREAPRSVLRAGDFSLRFLVSALLVLLTAALARRRACRRAEKEPVIGAERQGAAHLLGAALALASVVAHAYSFASAIGLLLLVPLSLAPRFRARPVALPRGHFEPIARATLVQRERRVRRRVLGRLDLLDATTLAGGITLALFVAVVLRLPGAFALGRDPFGFGLLCAVPSWLIGARLRFPRDIDERLHALAEAARGSVATGCALRLVGYVSEDGVLHDPRLRVLPARSYAGLVRIDLLADTRRDAPSLVLSAVVQAGAPVHRWLERALPRARREHRGAAKRIAFVQAVDDLDVALEALLRDLAQASREEAVEIAEDAAHAA